MNFLIVEYGNMPLILVPGYLNRPLWTLYIEWWLHNIGYYLTKPFKQLQHLNQRFKDVDLNAWPEQIG